MNKERLTWFDWALLIACGVLIAHMPVLLDMHGDAAIRHAAEAPFIARGVRLP